MLRVVDLHTHLIGKICKLTELGVQLEKEYQEMFGVGSWITAKELFGYCYSGNKYELSLMFIDEKPIRKHGLVWYCVKEIGVGVSGDWHWFTLNQLIICDENQDI